MHLLEKTEAHGRCGGRDPFRRLSSREGNISIDFHREKPTDVITWSKADYGSSPGGEGAVLCWRISVLISPHQQSEITENQCYQVTICERNWACPNARARRPSRANKPSIDIFSHPSARTHSHVYTTCPGGALASYIQAWEGGKKNAGSEREEIE